VGNADLPIGSTQRHHSVSPCCLRCVDDSPNQCPTTDLEQCLVAPHAPALTTGQDRDGERHAA